MPFYTGPYAFLSTKPINRYMSLDHPEWLYIWPTQDIDAAELTTVLYYNSDELNTTRTISLGDLKTGKAIWVDISHDTRNYSASGEDPVKIEMYITDPIYDKLTYHCHSPIGDNTRAIYYFNSLGGLDSLVVTTAQQESYEFNGVEQKKPMETGFTLAQDYMSRITQTRGNLLQQVHTGHKPSGEITALRDLFLIKRAYEYRLLEPNYPFLVPIIPQVDSISFPSTRENLKQLSFSYKYATEQRAYDRVS